MATALPVATAASLFEARRVLVGRIFERAFAVVRHNPVVTICLILLFCAVPRVTYEILIAGVNPSALVMTVGGYALPGSVALFLLQWFVYHLMGALGQGALVLPVLAEDEGRKASFAESAQAVARSIVPLLLLGSLLGIAVEIGATLLIVPGVLIYLLWGVAPSALAAEREGIFMALNRSQELTQGARWKVFGTILTLEAIDLVLTTGVTIFAARLLEISLTTGQFSVGYVITMGLLSNVVNLIWSTVQASLYVELMRSKEGGSTETLAEVFA
jgi:hypothetical protein